MSMEESISLEETNKIRISLGLKPLTEDKAPEDDKEKQAEQNYTKQREREAKEREAKYVSFRFVKCLILWGLIYFLLFQACCWWHCKVSRIRPVDSQSLPSSPMGVLGPQAFDCEEWEQRCSYAPFVRVRNRRELNASLKGATLGDADGDIDNAVKWLKTSKKREKELAKKRQEELEQMDKVFQGQEYTERE